MKKLMLGFAGETSSGKGTATDLVKAWYPGTPSFRFSDSLRDFYRLLLQNFPQLREHKVPRLFEDHVAVRLVEILKQSFGSDLGATGTRYVAFHEFAYWLVGRFMPLHSGSWPETASTADLQGISTAVRKFFGEDTLERAIMFRVAQSGIEQPCVIIEGIRRMVDISTLMNDPNVPFRLTYVEAEPSIRFERHQLRNEKPGDDKLSFAQFLELGQAEAEGEIRSLRPHAHAIIPNDGTPKNFERRLKKVVMKMVAEILQ
ncbi:MAG: hypothetical protein A2845_04975 [Candidatus Lloydbacteria bacterium RIFCSPHIGHO2_01_FULL_49_22]|uniref:Uncharacterized protein n=1 Tax=Candidatus Lloydbacteria bacterium RIFCSPHIGHO2_01_FULL_49_22 TaxID=1798658 RepID=A0A1G2CYC0_9BACT|nr:MAG: hypothetical protein A2845_04975 [Candidatus Lloydbacteria bacterium RIFCSPHIGHO2_01_FULL_49_22]OGZ10164.1 MAG: hypothetical protein A3C14_01010 [Candidatus Lloydbacteria bacterium RIFCSPHIGHO2_02_FULL_50_18]